MRTVWFTGLPCSGKTTLAAALVARLNLTADPPWPHVHLDGDVVRTGLNIDCDFSDAGRRENLRRVAHVCRIFNDRHIETFCSFIAPLQFQRDMISMIADVVWVYCDCPPEVCEARDVKGMWAKARAGEIEGFTGVDAPYEIPAKAIHVDTEHLSVEEGVDFLWATLSLSE